VIASDTGDLMLDTGSFEYSNIKGNDRSYNVGGGVNAGSDSKSVNATYGFTDKRQTNFATIGEGTIKVRDTSASLGAGGSADLSKLNRDTTKSQYSTLTTGLEGGFTLDTATVNLIAHPEHTVVGTEKAIKEGYEVGKKITIETTERIGNCYKSINEGDGLTWENQDERVERLENELLYNDRVPFAEGIGDNNFDRLLVATDPKKMSQHSRELKEMLGEVQDEIIDDDSDMQKTIKKLNEIKQSYEEKIAKIWREIDPEFKNFEFYNSETSEAFKKLSLPEQAKIKEYWIYGAKAIDAEKALNRQIAIHDYVINTPRDRFINETSSELCNVESYWQYGVSVKKEDRDFKKFYTDELNRGRIGSVNDGKANAYYGAGGYYWANKYDLDLDGSLKNTVIINNKTVYKPIDESASKDFLAKNTRGVAKVWVETYTPGVPRHHIIIGKGADGVWYNLDHNRDANVDPKPFNFQTAYKITQEKVIIEKAK